MTSPPVPGGPGASLQPYLGRWEGDGRGLWAAEPPFRFRARLELEAVEGRPLVLVSLRTWALPSLSPSHAEQGFLRALPGGELELLLTTGSGYLELHRGEVAGLELRFELQELTAAASARPLTGVSRRLQLTGRRLLCETGIAVDGGPPSPHVEADLARLP